MLTNYNSLPLVSVLMGIQYCSDDTRVLQHSLDSILNQDYIPLEFIICEYGSSPNAKELLQQYAATYEHVQLINGVGAHTLAAKLNRCMRAASGEFLARQDDDDVSDPTRISKEIEYLHNHPTIGFVGCNVHVLQGGHVIDNRIFPEFPSVKDFLFVQPFIHPTLIFRRSVLEQVEGYNEASWCSGCEDYDLLLRLYGKGICGANVQENLFKYRIPLNGQNHRTFFMRCNEVRVRWNRFWTLGLMPRSLFYVIKPVLVGLLPMRILTAAKLFVYQHY